MNNEQKKAKWLDALEITKGDILVRTAELRKAQDYRDHTYGETYDERRKAAREIGAEIKKLHAKEKRLIRNLDTLEGPPVHHDIFGQELKVGCAVAWSTGGRYAGATMGYVARVSHKMVGVVSDMKYADQSYAGSNVWPKNLIVVDKLL